MSHVRTFVHQRIEPAALLTAALGIIGFNYLTAFRVGGYFPLLVWAGAALACAALFWLVVGKQRKSDGDTKTWFLVGRTVAGVVGVAVGWMLHLQLSVLG